MEAGKPYDFEVRIAYADTDRMGVVYYANYLVLFERGRTEFMRNAGLRYRDLEEKERLFMPVMEAHVDYMAPARYDDLIRVRTTVTDVRSRTVKFDYRIEDATTGMRLASASTTLASINREGKLVALPAEVRKLMEDARS